MGLVGTMAALVLGLLVASAKSSYDALSNELTQMCETRALSLTWQTSRTGIHPRVFLTSQKYCVSPTGR
jgi:hypothetical protein